MKRFALLLLAGVVTTACGDGDDDVQFDAPVDAPADASDPIDAGIDAPGYYGTVPAVLNRDLDVIVVVDNSGSMLAEQQNLAVAFPQFINVLQQIAGGLPDLHLGVLSSNVGAAGQTGVPACANFGDDGRLLTGPEGSICAAQFGLQGTFISDIAQPDGSRARNYTGELSQLFTCMASLGNAGCGFEQHLESMYRSLQPGRNAGFYREDAHLAVLFLADEDDCSTEMGTMFGDPNAGLASALGPRTSFRCHEFGVVCDNDPNPRAFGPKSGCRPRDSSQYMYEVDRYVDFLKNLKPPGGGEVVVAGILGTFDPVAGEVTVGPDINNAQFPAVQRSCFTFDPNDPDDGATPPVRLRAVLDSFDRNVHTTVCGSDLSDALVEIAGTIKDAIGNPCLEATLADGDPQMPGLQPSCRLTDVVGNSETIIRGCTQLLQTGVSECDPGAGGTPCWCLIQDPQHCPSTPGNQAVSINRGGAVPPSGTVTHIFCETE